MKKFATILLCLIMIYACVQTPIINQADVTKVDFEKLLDQKVGKSCVYLLFGFIPIKNRASVAQAAWKAGIKKVSYVETENGYFPLLPHSCVIVYGE